MRILFGMLAVALGAGGGAELATAAIVVNPGPVELRYQSTETRAAAGTAYADGVVAIPHASVEWPLVVLEGSDLGGSPSLEGYEIRGTGTGPILATIDPSTGAAALDPGALRLELFMTGQYAGLDFTLRCDLGVTEDPVDLAFETNHAEGQAYDQQAGTFHLATTADLPPIEDATDCDLSGNPLIVNVSSTLVSFGQGFVGDVSALGISLAMTPVLKSPTQLGTAGADTLTGTAFAEVIRGLGGSDVIRGLGDADKLIGDGGADQIQGAGGADRIEGGAGSDAIGGGSGADLIRTDDGVRDVVRCGTGRDRVRADTKDRLVGCEVRL